MPVNLFAPWRPDVTDIGTEASDIISGVVPRADGYGPFKDFVDFTQALPANCRGFFFARRSDGSIAVFAGTVDRLYLLDNTSFAWTDVSKGGVAYGSLVGTDNWRFAQFNEFVIAVQINTVPQKYTLNAGGVFADLGGGPPQALHIAIVNRFVLLTGLLSNPRRAHWSDLDAPETWTAGIGLCDFQDFPDGGIVHACSGGDAYGVVFQDEAIRSLVFAAGSPAVFQITRISTQDTLDYQYSVINAGTRTFFHSAQGFKVIVAGGEPVSIGKEYVDAYFAGDVDTASPQLVIGAADPQGTRVFWAYKSQAGQAGLFDKILCFDWSIKDRPWSMVPMSGQFLGYLAKPGLTLEALDAIAPGGLTVTGAASSPGGAFGAGKVRLTLNPGVANPPNFQIAGQNFIVVQNVGGTTEANGTWLSSQISIVDAAHLDINVAFVHAWTAGGRIGGSLDALPFSLDSISTSAIAQLAAVGPAGALGFYSGPNIEAILETPSGDADGRPMVFVSGLTPMTDSPDAMCSIGYRMRAADALTYTDETQVNEDGFCPQILEARYCKGRLRIPAGSTWRYARGIRPDVGVAGKA